MTADLHVETVGAVSMQTACPYCQEDQLSCYMEHIETAEAYCDNCGRTIVWVSADVAREIIETEHNSHRGPGHGKNV